MKGKVWPVTGIKASEAPICTEAWIRIQAVTPMANNAPNRSGAFSAMPNAR